MKITTLLKTALFAAVAVSSSSFAQVSSVCIVDARIEDSQGNGAIGQGRAIATVSDNVNRAICEGSFNVTVANLDGSVFQNVTTNVNSSNCTVTASGIYNGNRSQRVSNGNCFVELRANQPIFYPFNRYLFLSVRFRSTRGSIILSSMSSS